MGWACQGGSSTNACYLDEVVKNDTHVDVADYMRQKFTKIEEVLGAGSGVWKLEGELFEMK